MKSKSTQMFCAGIAALLALYVILAVRNGNDGILSAQFVMSYDWPIVLIAACAVFIASYATNSVKVTTIGTALAAVAFILCFDWSAAFAQPLSFFIVCLVASVALMVLAMLSFSVIWLKYNQFTIPKHVSKVSSAFALAACVCLALAPLGMVDGFFDEYMFFIMIMLTVFIDQASSDLAGKHYAADSVTMSLIAFFQLMILLTCHSGDATSTCNFDSGIFLTICTMGLLAEFAYGEGYVDNGAESLKAIAKQPGLLAIFAAQVVMLSVDLGCVFALGETAEALSIVSNVYFFASALSAGIAYFQLSRIEKAAR